MDYVTDRGTFASLQEIRAAYVQAPDREDYRIIRTSFDWRQDILHASDVGSCPRAVAYRLSGAEKKPMSARRKANRSVMFDRSYDFHYLTYSALNWAGLLIENEGPVEMAPGWEGTFDATFTLDGRVILYDCKTVLPNMLKYYRYDLPKRKDCLQVAGVYAPRVVHSAILIEYADRAGANTPEECWLEGNYQAEVETTMRALEDVRDCLPALPPTLEPVYAGTYANAGNPRPLKTVEYKTPWDCGYCDYHLTKKEKRVNPNSGRMKEYSYTCSDSLCKPINDPPLTVAEWDGSRLVKVKPGHSEGCERFIEQHITSYVPYEEEE